MLPERRSVVDGPSAGAPVLPDTHTCTHRLHVYKNPWLGAFRLLSSKSSQAPSTSSTFELDSSGTAATLVVSPLFATLMLLLEQRANFSSLKLNLQAPKSAKCRRRRKRTFSFPTVVKEAAIFSWKVLTSGLHHKGPSKV